MSSLKNPPLPPLVVVHDIDQIQAVDNELRIDVADESGSLSREVDVNSLSPDGDSHVLPVRVEQLRLDEDNLSAEGSSENEDDNALPEPTGAYRQPSDALSQKISDIVEEYFSNDNVLYDTFLLKHVLKQRVGYVNLKLVTSFKRLKKLTKDYRQVAFAIRKCSTTLDVNEEGKRVKRKKPLPEYKDTPQGRSCLLIGLPEDDLMKTACLVDGCGKVECIRLLLPGQVVPPDTRKVIGKGPEISIATAFVHFWHFSSVDILNAKQIYPDWPAGLRLERIKDPRAMMVSTPSTPNQSRRGSGASGGKPDTFRGRSGSHEKSRSRTSTMDNSDTESGGEGRHRHGSRVGIDGNWRDQGSTSPASSPGVSPRGSPRPGRRNGKHGRSPLATAAAEARSAGTSPCVERRQVNVVIRHTPNDSPHTVRKPIAPDARAGFGRGVPLPSSNG